MESNIFNMSRNQRISPSLSENIGLQQARMQSSRGFSLIEVMVVVGILGVLTAVAVPSFQEWRQHGAVNNAVSTLYLKLKQARALAVAESRSVTVTFTITAPYGVVFDDQAGCTYCKHENNGFNQFSPNIIFNANGPGIDKNITFTRTGRADARTVKVSLNGYYKCIAVNIIGKTHILDDQSALASATCQVL